MTKLLNTLYYKFSNYRLLFSCLAVALPLGLVEAVSANLLRPVQSIEQKDLLSEMILSGSWYGSYHKLLPIFLTMILKSHGPCMTLQRVTYP
jgi:hypothetical protein